MRGGRSYRLLIPLGFANFLRDAFAGGLRWRRCRGWLGRTQDAIVGSLRWCIETRCCGLVTPLDGLAVSSWEVLKCHYPLVLLGDGDLWVLGKLEDGGVESTMTQGFEEGRIYMGMVRFQLRVSHGRYRSSFPHEPELMLRMLISSNDVQ